MRFIRDFELVVGVGDAQAVKVVPPIRISFTAEKNTDGTLSKLSVKVYNLKDKTRDYLTKSEDDKKYIPVSLSVGHQGQKRLIFKGNVRQAGWQIEGADFVTTLEAEDGGADIVQSYTSTVAGSKREAIAKLVSDMKHTKLAGVSSVDETTRPIILVGNSHDQIKKLSGAREVFIEDEQLFILDKEAARKGYAPLVNASTGLLDKPEVEAGKITFITIINPTLKLGGMCKLESARAPKLSGAYKITAIMYSGDTEGQDWIQKIEAVKI